MCQDIACWLYVADAHRTSHFKIFSSYFLPTMDPTHKPSNQDEEKGNKGARCVLNIIRTYSNDRHPCLKTSMTPPPRCGHSASHKQMSRTRRWSNVGRQIWTGSSFTCVQQLNVVAFVLALIKLELQTGVFSATVAAFLIESYKTLKPDPGEVTVRLLQQVTQQLAAISNGTQLALPTSDPFIPKPYAIHVNIMWFLSLCISLSPPRWYSSGLAGTSGSLKDRGQPGVESESAHTSTRASTFSIHVG